MKKLILSTLLVIILTITLSSCNAKKEINDDVMSDYIDSLIEDTDSYIPAWNKESFKARWNYIDGVFLNSIVNLSESLKDIDKEKSDQYKEFFLKYVNYYVSEDGKFINPTNNEESYNATELDSVCESKILFDAYRYTKDERYTKAIDYTYQNLINMHVVENSYGNFSHKASYKNQVWLDGMYMYAPFYARYAKENNANDIYDVITNQYRFIREKMYDEEKGLYYHGYSSEPIFWANYYVGCSRSFWLRSIGWYLVSLADVLDYFPDGENKNYLISLLDEALKGVLKYKDEETSMFYQVVDKGNITVEVPKTYFEGLKNKTYMKDGKYVAANVSNYLESSGSSMISYALMKSAKKGYIDSSYFDEGAKILKGIYKHSFDEKSKTLSDICITAGLGPTGTYHRDGTMEYYLAEPVGSNDAKGVGPFIMAYLMYKYNPVG